MPGSFDDSIDSLFGDDLVGDSTTFSDVTPSAMLYSNAAQAQGDRSDSSYGMLPATERARQAALQRQEQQFRNSDMLLPESQFISSHQTQRPGSLTNGSANLLQFGSATSTPYTQSYSRGGLRDIINRTAGYDYTNAVDRLGNPLDQRIIDLIGNHESSPSQEEGIERLLANLNSEAEFKDEDGVADPEELAYPLYKHQRRALRWMRQSEEDDHKKGGILADEMGLGKTISTLALIVSRRAQPSEGDNSPQVRYPIYKEQKREPANIDMPGQDDSCSRAPQCAPPVGGRDNKEAKTSTPTQRYQVSRLESQLRHTPRLRCRRHNIWDVDLRDG